MSRSRECPVAGWAKGYLERAQPNYSPVLPGKGAFLLSDLDRVWGIQ